MCSVVAVRAALWQDCEPLSMSPCVRRPRWRQRAEAASGVRGRSDVPARVRSEGGQLSQVSAWSGVRTVVPALASSGRGKVGVLAGCDWSPRWDKQVGNLSQLRQVGAAAAWTRRTF